MTNGTGENTFSPDAPVTRQQAATLIYRLVRSMGEEFTYQKAKVTFEDWMLIGDYAIEAVEAMQQAGILEGVGGGRFEPEGKTNRAAAAKILNLVILDIHEKQ